MSAPEGGARARLGPLGLLGVALSVSLVILLALRLDLGAVARAALGASPAPLVGATLVYCSLFPLRGLRWAILLRPLAPVPTGLATRAFLIGFMANNLLPARLGDVVRAWVLARQASAPGGQGRDRSEPRPRGDEAKASPRATVPTSASFATVLLERVFDGLTVVGILTVALLMLPLDEASADRTLQLQAVAALMGLVFGSALLVCALLVAWERPTLRLVAAMLGPLSRRGEGPSKRIASTLLSLFQKLASGLHVLKNARRTAVIAALSLLIWSLEVVVYGFVALALDIEVAPLGLALVMAILTLGLTAPSAPGFVGVFEALVIPALGLLGVPVAEAAAFAFVLHAIHYFPGTLLGLWAAWTAGLRFTDLTSRSPAESRPWPEAGAPVASAPRSPAHGDG